MYEHLRNELGAELALTFSTEQVNFILASLDKVAVNYEVSPKSTELMVYDGDYLPREVKLYLSTAKLEGKSDKTIKLYSNRLSLFFANINKPIHDIATNDIRAFLVEYQSRRGISDVSLDKYRQILHSFLKWCVDEEYLIKNPCANIKRIKFEDNTRKALTRFQLEKLRRACKTERERAIVEVLYSTGARVTELCNMRRSEINIAEKSIEVLGKGKRRYTVYFNEASQVALDIYDDSRTDDSDWLFVSTYAPYKKVTPNSIEKLFRNLSERVGFYVCPHIMRHTTATLALQGGASIDTVQKQLNHKSVATTQRYAETSIEDVKTAHRKYVI